MTAFIFNFSGIVPPKPKNFHQPFGSASGVLSKNRRNVAYAIACAIALSGGSDALHSSFNSITVKYVPFP